MPQFLVANMRLYFRVCPSIGRSVRNAFFFVTAEFKPKSDLTSVNAPAKRDYWPACPPCFKINNRPRID